MSVMLEGLARIAASGGSFIDEYEYKEITDTWEQIVASCANGTYRRKYKIGNYKPLDLGRDRVVRMQITGKRRDTLSNGGGRAPLTWMGIELLYYARTMKKEDVAWPRPEGYVPDETKYSDFPCWNNSFVREYLNDTVFPILPECLQTGIKEVIKTHIGMYATFKSDGGLSRYYLETGAPKNSNDKLWIPKASEISNIPVERRIKSIPGSTTPYVWWLRDSAYAGTGAGQTNGFQIVTTAGIISASPFDSYANMSRGVNLCFCT